jgi:glycopeptide antibiotics resistance protein
MGGSMGDAESQRSARRASRRWVLWGLGIYGLAVAVVLVLPVGYASIVGHIGEWIRTGWGIAVFGTGWIEFAATIPMFAPLGFLLTLLFQQPWWGVLLALVLSSSAELGQILIPSRQPSVRDVLANALGAALGALLAWLLVLRRDKRGPGQPAPDSAA